MKKEIGKTGGKSTKAARGSKLQECIHLERVNLNLQKGMNTLGKPFSLIMALVSLYIGGGKNFFTE